MPLIKIKDKRTYLEKLPVAVYYFFVPLSASKKLLQVTVFQYNIHPQAIAVITSRWRQLEEFQNEPCQPTCSSDGLPL